MLLSHGYVPTRFVFASAWNIITGTGLDVKLKWSGLRQRFPVQVGVLPLLKISVPRGLELDVKLKRSALR